MPIGLKFIRYAQICVNSQFSIPSSQFINYLCGTNERGCPVNGLRLYPMNLIRTVPAEGLEFKILVYPFSFGLTN